LQELNILTLLLPPETITYSKNRGKSTIDLVFSSSHLSNSLTSCCSREDLDHGSDHYPVEITFLFSPHVSPFVPKPQWKKADNVALALRARELDLLPGSYENCKDIDEGVERLVRWIK
jgi:hypothetical protein